MRKSLCYTALMKTRRKVGRESVRKIQQTKGSYLISIPMRIMRQLGWKERQKVVVRQRGRGFMVRDWTPRTNARQKRTGS